MFAKTLASAVIVVTSATASFGATVSPLSLTDSVPVFETVNALSNGSLNDQNWFIFHATTGASIDIDINRLAAPPDLYARLYFGDVTGVDFGAATATGLSLLASSDDAENDAFGGPFGDPRFTFTAPSTGTYSFYVTALSGFSGNGAVGSPFEVIATGIDPAPSPVPLPAGLPLLAAALGAFGLVLRRGRDKRS